MITVRLRCYVVLCLCFCAHVAFAQTDLVCKRVKVAKEAFVLDSLTVLPATITSPDAPAIRLMYDMNTGKAYFYGDLPTQDSLTVCYQRLPANLTRWVGKRDVRLADTTDQYWKDIIKRYEQYAPPREQLIELKDFQKSGNFVRGLSLGNTQNVFVNSALNLQLEGKISEDLTLTATISDQQIPYQPEGNTLQLQDIDRVFMRLAHKHGNLTVGDIVLQNKDNHFLKFYKNTQGGFIETNYNIGKANAQTFGGMAVAKGKFYSATLAPLEGVQGPYRLKGPNGELFIIIMANSEKVFIDGKLLQRGYNYDYVIDYNVGEIIFNSHILITRFTRLRVDYEYAERNYTRTIFTIGHEQKNTRSRFLTQLYREADNPNNPLISITDEAKAQLRNQTGGIGLVNGVDSIGYNPNEVLYRLTDSTDITGTYPSVLVYSNDTQKAVYRATFTYVGEKKGNYIRINSNLNGQVYQWVRPINGERQGNYEPLKTIPLPNKKQLWVNNFSYNLATHAQIIADVAISKQQNNAFSDVSEASMTGLATRIAYLNTGKDIKDSARYVPFGGISYEYNQASFTVIDRFRSIEFDRDWNKNIDSSRFDDHILQTEIGIKNKKNNLFSYKFLGRKREQQVNGFQQTGLIQYQFKKIQLKGNVFFLDSRQDSLRALWQRWQGEILYKGRYFTPSYRWNGDKNRVFLPTNDSVTNSLMYFEEHTFGLRSADSSRFHYTINYSIRADKTPFEGRIAPYLNAHTWSFQTNFITKRNQNFLLTAIYRKATAYNANAQGGENLQGRLDWNGIFKIGNMYKKTKIIPNPIDSQAIKKTKIPILTLRSELSLTTSTGQELQKEYYFLLVAVGQGTHTWRDDNDNGLRELNEFYLAINPDEKKYVKIFRPTAQYIPAFAQTLTYRLNWQTNSPTKNAGFLSGLFSWNINRRFIQNDLLTRLFPIITVEKEKLLAEQNLLRNTIFFNRNHLQYNGELTYQSSLQKQLLTNGFEEKSRQEIKGTWRNKINNKWTLQTAAIFQEIHNTSDFLQNRNFNLTIYQFSPEFSYQNDNNKRVAMSYQYTHKDGNNVNESTLPAVVHQISVEMRYSKLSRRNITTQIRYLNIAYTGEKNTPLAYEMLEALQVGSNVTWQTNWTERLQNGLQITFSYEGRKSANTPLIHLGRAQIGLLF